MYVGVMVEVRSSEAREPICLPWECEGWFGLYNSRFKNSSLGLVSRIQGWVWPSSIRALEKGLPSVTSSEPLSCLLAYTDSQSDTDTLTTPGEVLDLTAQAKEQPPAEGASEISPASQDLAIKEAKAAAAPSEEEEEKETEENPEPEEECRVEESTGAADAPEEDTASNQSLDLDFATKLMDFKLAESEAGSVDSQGPAQQEPKHACDTCGKNFKFLGTLSRHKKAHSCQEPKEEEAAAPSLENEGVGRAVEGPSPSPEPEEKPAESLAIDPTPGTREASVAKQNEETEGPTDGEGTAEKRGDGDKRPKTDSPKSMASKADKRKKVCSVCNKRFWSLQDLTRHMRSHTGMRDQSQPARRGGLQWPLGVSLEVRSRGH